MKCRFGRGKILCLGPWQAEGDCRSRCAAERERIGACARTKIWAAGSLRMRKHPSKVFLVLFLQKKNGTLKLSRAPRLEREIVKTRLRVLTRFPKAREQKTGVEAAICPRGHAGPARSEGSFRRVKAQCAKTPLPARLRGHILPVGTWPIRQELPRATEKRRSASGAAVMRTRGGKLGWVLGCACSSGGKTVVGFPTAPGRAWGLDLGGRLG